MVWSLIARRLTFGAVASVAPRTVHPATFSLSVVARRTLFATPQLNFPPAEKSRDTAKKTASKPAEAKTGKSKGEASKKKGRQPKNLAKGHQKASKEKKQRVRIPKSLKPPKRAPSPYALFYASYFKSQPKSNTLQETQELIKRASEIWKGYSIAEKQPFYDENEDRKVQAKKARDEFFRNTSASDLKQLNAIRKAQGKKKYHSTEKKSTPVSAFILFSNEFRNSPDGQAVTNDTSQGEPRPAVRTAIVAGQRWKSMSEQEKAPYFERFRKAKEELKAEHAES